MGNPDTLGKRWNLFARELEDILAKRNLGLGHLDDRAGVHREKVRRLIQSLRTPKSFPVLNAEEINRIAEEFVLNETEVLQLRAAVLATSIEKTLMDRINQDDALLAAEQLFPTIFKALQEQVEGISGLGTIRRGDTDLVDDDELDMLLGSVLDAIDDAHIALHLSRNVSSHGERVEQARRALTNFEKALTELDEVAEEVRALSVWRYWYDEAQKGLAIAHKRLEELGEI